jgi:hypothetical protein
VTTVVGNPGGTAIVTTAATLNNPSLVQTSGYDTLNEFADLLTFLTATATVPAYLRAFTSGTGGAGSTYGGSQGVSVAPGSGGIPSLLSPYSFSTIFNIGSDGIKGGVGTVNGNSTGLGGVASIPGICGGGGGGGAQGSSNAVQHDSNAGAAGYFGGGGGGGFSRNNTTGMTGGNGGANTGGGGGGGGSQSWTSTNNAIAASAGGTGGSGRIIVYYRA